MSPRYLTDLLQFRESYYSIEWTLKSTEDYYEDIWW